jgi:outer membrane immunogenic protein
MRQLLLSTVAIAALAGQAFAADLPSRKEAPVYVAPAPIYNWTGFYGGLDIGGSFGNANLWVPGNPINGYTFSHNANNDGVIGGGFIGYNYQVNNFVLGLQGEFDGTGTGNSKYSSLLGGDTYQSSFNQNWIASIDGRLGYAMDRTLLYVLGGVAWSSNSAHLNNLGPGVDGNGSWSETNTRTGYDFGGGIEYAFTNNWTGRLEYRYYNFGTANYTGSDPFLGNTYYRTTLTNNVIRVGLAYKFGAPEPVVAKY